MNLLNYFSIKTRMLALVLLPLIFASVLSGLEINTQHNHVQALNMVNHKIDFLQSLSKLNSSINNVREDLFNQSTNVDFAQLNSDIQQIEQQLPSSFSAQYTTEMQAWYESISEANKELPEIAVDGLNDWSTWINELQVQALNTLEKDRTNVSEEINRELAILYQLQWLSLWSIDEKWLISQLLLNRNNNELLNQLNTITERQQLLVERFIDISAKPEQVALLLDTFSDKAFEQSYQLRSHILKGEALAESTQQSLAAFSQRLNSIQYVVSTFSEQLTDNIHGEIQHSKNLILLFCIALLASLLCIGLIGANLYGRIINYLRHVIKTMSQIEETHDYSQKINEAGHDELSVFSSKLNNLINERHQNDKKILRAKSEAEKANQAKSSFLANMSHEIRTPLNGIIGMSDIMSSTKLTTTQKEYLQTIETSSQALLLLINDILDLSKIESGNLSITNTDANISEVIYDTLTIVLAKVVEKNLDLEVEIDADMPHLISLDEHRMRQVLMNLLSNAVKFTNKGSIKVVANASKDSAGYIDLTIHIIDSGIGIAKDKQQQIFSPFTQEDDTITRQFGGTGLGLAICKQLVELMGGTISIESVKGEGCCFTIALKSQIVTLDQPKDSQFNGLTAALISNNSELTEQLNKECQQQGFTLNYHYQSCFDLLQDKQAFDLLFIDSTCSTRDAIETLPELLQQKNIFTIAVNTPKEKRTLDNMDATITLPLLGNRFRNAIHNGIENRQLRQKQQPVPHGTDVETTEPVNIVVLIVEDNLVNQKVASLLIKQAGFDFIIANNGQEAFEFISTGESIHAILMDCMMPVMDGFTATEKIRAWENDNSLQRLPIIALTASVLDQDIQKCYQSGMDDYLAKPFKKEALLHKLKSLPKLAS
ncbi:hybrid sensor histidine kinase/response regulator [Shewanella fidelis]|uniref:Sensory/regulatory protein RpfC n=1 Tax=Shewanella fidelis TaxID=173509 RepID=A0AAW8NU93_9GAMM|nr:ATP-binding protein [Shewanella fidelis]MDR8526131.1 ATP-binding protein [Shewanella fidelis]MDW4813744.1 ATP-binding protein [Shewanella fidelis]MDW4817840.1 ATP-binding protein [Shewanella fidelis]MDW4821899.1 ATP-binding protein [Shewanella fidelis]MDW4826072.1 ATP-binding protein [Shewanella fidelis]